MGMAGMFVKLAGLDRPKWLGNGADGIRDRGGSYQSQSASKMDQQKLRAVENPPPSVTALTPVTSTPLAVGSLTGNQDLAFWHAARSRRTASGSYWARSGLVLNE